MTDADGQTAFAARRLWRAARAATLATQQDGQPFASLVTPAIAPDGSALLLLSSLSAHTRHLAAEPRCALMVTGAAEDANPQTAPRLTVTGRAVPERDPNWRGYWLARHPYAALYAGFTDFALWRVTPEAGHFVAGFARAGRLTAQALLPIENAVAALREAEPRILAHCNKDHQDALRLLAGLPEADAGQGGQVTMIGVDADGFDVLAGNTVHRIAFDAPVDGAPGVRAALVLLVQAARNKPKER